MWEAPQAESPIPKTTPAVGHKITSPPSIGFGTLEGHDLKLAVTGFFRYS